MCFHTWSNTNDYFLVLATLKPESRVSWKESVVRDDVNVILE